MPDNKKKDGFIMQAGILAAAGIIVRIIGLLYNSPMTAILGDEGIGYYNTAYNAYTIVLLISSYSIPSAISKVIAQKLAVREYRNAHRIFQCAFIYVLAVGGIASLFVFFGAGLLVKIDHSILALRVLAPTIFFSGILGVLRGYFQAHKSMVQTSVSQILEQILNAVGSILMAYLLMNAAADREKSEGLSWGAMGGAIGTGIGVLAALLFMAGVYRLNSGMIKKRIEKDAGHKEESYGAVFKMIILVVTPFILSTFIYNANTFINQNVYQWIMIDVKKMADTQVAAYTGVIGKAVKVSNIPIALASAMATALIPGISGDYARKNLKGARQKVAKAMKVTMLIAIPAAVGLAVLAKPVMLVLYPQKESIDLSSALLAALSVSVIFYSMSTLSNAVLQSIGKLNAPVINAAIALVLQTAALAGALWGLDAGYGTYYYIVAIILYSFLMCLLNGVSIRRNLGYRQEADRTFFRPALASGVMGGAAYGVYQGLYLLFHLNILALVLAVAVAVLVYFVLIIRMGVLTREELKALPKGHMLVHFACKMKLMRPEAPSSGKGKPDLRKQKETSRKKQVSKKKKAVSGSDQALRNYTDPVDENAEDFWLDD